MRFQTRPIVLRLPSARSGRAASLGAGEIPNIRLSQAGTSPNEVSIAISPADPLRIAAGSNLRYVYRSSDGGLTLGPERAPTGEPMGILRLRSTPAGCSTMHIWQIFRVGTSLTGSSCTARATAANTGWIRQRSASTLPCGGRTKSISVWTLRTLPTGTTSIMAGLSLTAMAAPTRHDSSRIRFARSTDGGASWSEPLRVSDAGGDCSG